MRNNKGFSLMELLTVIAIIAVLSAIIFPAMTSVGQQARKQQCITQLHEIALRADMYKRDNRRYPDVLGPVWQDGKSMETADKGTQGSLYAAGYIDNPRLLHCPMDVNDDSETYVFYKNGTKRVCELLDHTETPPTTPPYPELCFHRDVYIWSSYDLYIAAAGVEVIARTMRADKKVCRYMLRWAEWDVGGDFTPEVPGLLPYPPGTADTPAMQQQDYARQLIFRNPPSDTVLTWCSNHADNPEGVTPMGEVVTPKGMAIVVYIDGHAEVQPADVVYNSRWRIKPR